MRIIFEGKHYDTETAEKVCGIHYDHSDDSEIEQYTEIIYRTDDRRYFSHVSRFYDSTDAVRGTADCFMEYFWIHTADDVIEWIILKAIEINDGKATIEFFPK